MVTATSEDTEITLGTGKMLALFFGLVVLCAVFFGMGFSLGKNSVRPIAGDLSPSTVTSSGVRPSAVKPNNSAAPAQEMPFSKTGPKDADAQSPNSSPNSSGATASQPTDANKSNPADSGVIMAPVAGYFVQVAAVSKQEDADALVDALKKKQYPATSSNLPTDKLFHVQVGPFADIKDAESMRTKLLGDGYNPILKK